ncbi:probable 28S ribosomal protein S25, mitochondrial [Mizuhopecten yessoensis]|uniref:probable 28S ribosomal protein S25, mitochondrial n=1 Tax=Mizuhopecten yessoensis TaxID=6573 RepID=UPI000B45CA0D|nr:probable 28S ribosomal protein S25, mitochondrial [Mizuhopecten yessoensis]
MPFLKGRAAMRRTMRYLESKPLFLKDEVRVLTVHYNNGQPASKGAYDFVFWHLPQLQYCNPRVQIVTFKNLTPSPFFQFYFGNGEKMLVDLDSVPRDAIMSHLQNTICKSSAIMAKAWKELQAKDNQANFGYSCSRWCICEMPGQVPCSGVVELPKEMRGKYRVSKKEEKEL